MQARFTSRLCHVVAIVALVYGAAVRPAAAGQIMSWEYDQIRPAVAYSSASDVYLVVWEDHHWGFGADWDIYGRRVSGSGSTIGGAFGISYDGPQHRLAPDVAYNSSLNEFLVVWEYEYSSSDHDIYAQRVATDGTPIGGQIAIATPTNFDGNPAVAFNASDEEYLVVWERRVGSDEFAHNDIYGQRLNVTGAPQGSPIPISTGSTDESAPAVAHATESNQYLVVWQDHSGGNYDIRGQRITGNGALSGGFIELCTFSGDQLRPRLVFNSGAGFLVVWEDHRAAAWSVYGQRLFENGTFGGGNFQISGDGAKSRLRPSVATKEPDREYFVTWEYAYSGTDHDVYGRRVARDGTLPGGETALSRLGSHEGTPAVAADKGQGYLVVWEDGRNSATMGLDVYGDIVRVPVISGHVYFGADVRPLSNVSVQLYCSSDSGNLGVAVANTTTATDGWFALPVPGTCEYYNLLETDGVGQVSLTAFAPGGTVVNANWIQYTHPLEGKILSGNAFYDSFPLPVAAINSPSGGTVAKGLVPVIGWANTSYLSVWVLDYGAGASPSEFSIIAFGMEPAIDELLANWDTAALPDGIYTLRLRVADDAAQIVEVTVTVNVQAATPTTTRTYTATATRTPTPTRTRTLTATPTLTRTPTQTATRTGTPSGTATATRTATRTPSSTPTFSATASPTKTLTSTPTTTATGTPTPTRTPTHSPTMSPTVSPTQTASPGSTPTRTYTTTPNPSATATSSRTPTQAATATSGPISTSTATATATSVPTPSPTPTTGASAGLCTLEDVSPDADTTPEPSYGSQWGKMLSLGATGIPGAVGPATSWTSLNGDVLIEHVAAADQDGHLILFYSYVGSDWKAVDVTEKTGSTIAIERPESWLFTEGNVVFEKLAAPAPNGDLLVFDWHSGSDWEATNVSATTGRKISGPVTSWITGGDGSSVEHLAARAANDDLLVFFRQVGGPWNVVNVTSITGQKVAGEPKGWKVEATGVETAEKVAAPASGGSLLLFTYVPSTNWQVINLTTVTGQSVAGPADVWFDPIAHFEKFAVRAPNGDLVVFYYGGIDPAWQVTNITSITGQRIGGPVSSWRTQGAGTWYEHIVAAGPDHHLYAFHKPTGGVWQVADITNLTGTTITERPTAWVFPTGAADIERVAAPNVDGRLCVFSFDPGSGWSVANASASAQGRTLYAAAPQAGVWKSQDYGVSWSQLTRPQPPPGQEPTGTLDVPIVIDLAVSPADPRIVFAATGNDHRDPSRTGLYRSTDAGATWSLVHQFYCKATVQPVTQVLLAPGRPSTVYAVGGCAIAISTDNGAPGSWTEVVPPGIIDDKGDVKRHVWHVAVSAELPGEVRRVFACGGGTLWYSHDSGQHWYEDAGTAGILPGGFCGASGITGHIPGPQALAIDPTNPQRVYLAHPSNANGPSYFTVGNNPPADGTYCNDTSANPVRSCGEGSLWYGDLTSFDPSNPETLSGTWSQLPGPPVYPAGDSGSAFVQTHASTNGYLVFFSDKGTVHVSAGKPTSTGWHRLDGWDASRSYRENRRQNVSHVHPDPHGLYVSSDFDLTLSPGLHHGDVYAYNAELNQCLGGRLWHANDGGIYRSDDCGETWVKAFTGLHTLAAVNIAVDARAPAEPGQNTPPALYFGAGDTDDLFSLDGGASWRDAWRQCGDCDSWFSDPGQPGRVFSILPRRNSFDVYTSATGHPDAGSQPTTSVAIEAGDAPFAVSWQVASGYRPIILTLSDETPLANGDYLTIRQLTPTRRVLLRARDSFGTASPWAQEQADLPGTADVVQAAGGHTSPTYYVGDGTRVWRSHRGTNGEIDRWDVIVPGGGAAVASRFFVNPYDADDIYIIDNNAIRHTTNGTQATVTWAVDPLLDAALNPGGAFTYRCFRTDRNIEVPAGCILNDLVFDREAPQTRFAVGMAGVFYSGDGVNWFRLLDTRALPSRPRAAWFDRYTDPDNRSLYIALDGRSIMRCQPIPAVAPSPLPTATPSATPTATPSPTRTTPPTPTATTTPAPGATATRTGQPQATATASVPASHTVTPTVAQTPTPTPTATATPLPQEWTFRGAVLASGESGRHRFVRGARVSLYRSTAPGDLGERVASSVTGPDGTFSMAVLNEPEGAAVYYFLVLDDPNYAAVEIIPGPAAERAGDEWIRYTQPPPGDHADNYIEVQSAGQPLVTIDPDVVALWNGPWFFIPVGVPIDLGDLTLDLSIQGIEITQATQCFAPGAGYTSCPDNSLPLTSERATAVRVYIGHEGGPLAGCAGAQPSQTFLKNVPVRLTWYTPTFGGGIPGAALWAGPSAVQYFDVPCATKLDDPADPAGSLRANAWGSATFIIPNPSGDALVVKAEVNANPAKYLEARYDNNGSGLVSAPLEARQPWKVKWALIDYQPWTSLSYPQYSGARLANSNVVGGVSGLMKQIYPIPVEYSQSTTIPYGGPDTRDDADFLLYSLEFIQMFMSSQPDSLFGWLPTGALDDASGTALWLGYGEIGGPAGYGVDRSDAGFSHGKAATLAHEIGHNRGLQHPNQGREPCWPFGTDTTIRESGFDVTLELPRDATQVDLMNSSAGSWLSPYTWMRLAGAPYSKAWAKLGAGCAAGTSASVLQAQTNMSQEVMLVRGTVYLDGGATIETPFITAGSPTPEGAPEARYCLELQASDGTVLASHCFDLSFVNLETEAPTDTASFAAALPFDDRAEWLVLRDGATIVAARGRNRHPPELQVLSVDPGPPGGNSLQVNWTAGSGEEAENPLRYTLLYSPDAGTSWIPVAVDVDTDSLDLDTSSWPGSEQARIRVLVSDGFLTSPGDSALFAVPRKPPSVWITSPQNDTFVQPLDALALAGHASDLEDGELKGATLVWTLDGDRILGAGAQLVLPGLSAEPGVHEIVLTATDQDGMESSAGIEVTVAAPPHCAADCNEDNVITVGELLRSVSVALGSVGLSECPLADSNNDGQVTVDEILTAVDTAINGCT